MTGPERSVITDADTTNAAVTAMRSASVRMKARSEDIGLTVVPAKRSASRDRIATAVRVAQTPSNSVSLTRGHGVWIPAFAGTTRNHTLRIVTESFGPFLMVW